MSYSLTTDTDPAKLPWIERYRAKRLDEIVGHDDNIKAIKNLIKNNSLPHYLFYGPPGTGKTSLILAIAREMYGDKYKHYVKEINASADRGIDTIRVNVVNFIKSRSDKVKLVILDEFDAMTDDAQSALRGVIEAYSGNNRFCLICNNINKIIPAIQSRCTKIRFSSLGPEAVRDKVAQIVATEQVNIEDEALDDLINLETDFRQVINILHSLHFMYKALGQPITSQAVYQHLGKPAQQEIDQIVQALLTQPFKPNFDKLVDLFRSNRWNLIDMIDHLLHKLLTLDLPIEQKNFLIDKLAVIDHRVRNSRDSTIQIAHLVSSFEASRGLSR